MNQTFGTVDDAWSQLEMFAANMSMVETEGVASDTESLKLSQEPHDLLGFPGFITFPDESDIFMAFGDPIPLSVQEHPGLHIVTPCSSSDYEHGARTHSSNAFNMLLGIATAVAYNQDIATTVPGGLLGEFCGHVGLENMILRVVSNARGFVTRRVVDTGDQVVEVSIRRSVLVKMFRYEGNDSGSTRLSEIFFGKTGKTRTSANIRKIWGSLCRDVKNSRSGKLRNNPGFLGKVGYRKLSAKNCEFFIRIPLGSTLTEVRV